MASFKTKQQQSFEELGVTHDELNNIGEALKKEEFRKLFHEYIDEITDPENQKVFEKEITELERERGNEVIFIHPMPGYVLKTSVEGEKKAFINICHNDNISKPTSIPDAGGLHWSIPYSLSQPREDLDKKKMMCYVFDVVFHPDTIRMSHENNKYKELVNDTAFNAIESNFKIKLDKTNVRYSKVDFKGYKHPSVIRRKIKKSSVTPKDDADQVVFDIPNYPYPPISEEDSIQNKTEYVPDKHVDKYAAPKFLIKQRRNVDMQDFTYSKNSKMNAAMPNELVVEVELPLIKSASNVALDVTERTLKLVSESPAKYKLDITLPYAVDEDKGNAEFDSRCKKLTVTLVVKQPKIGQVFHELGKEDSGVDSDIGSRSNESGSEDETNKKDAAPKVVENVEQCKSEIYENFRTNTSASFLDMDKHYTVPNFTCNVLDDVIAFTFHVRNVEPNSVESKYLDKNSGLHLKFTSLGSGYFPIDYSFCVKFPNNVAVDSNNLNVEVWDNNVIAQISLIGCDNVEHLDQYFTGIDADALEKCDLPNPVKLIKVLRLEDKISKPEPSTDIAVVKFSEENVILEVTNLFSSLNAKENVKDEPLFDEETLDQSGNNFYVANQEVEGKRNISDGINSINSNNDDDDEVFIEDSSVISEKECKKSKNKQQRKQEKAIRKRLAFKDTISQSFSETLPLPEITESKPKGILKVRSLSESSIDGYHSISSSVDCCSDNFIEKHKKTVRFNESVSKKTYRTNSSILGQKKKNQRRSRNKKRAQERRASESENSECESEDIRNLQERDSKSDEETSETQSDVSESDDGYKTENIDVMSLSKRNPHKRGGKKSARKSANTAKMELTNNLIFDLDM